MSGVGFCVLYRMCYLYNAFSIEGMMSGVGVVLVRTLLAQVCVLVYT
jgi:hypothetical protein